MPKSPESSPSASKPIKRPTNDLRRKLMRKVKARLRRNLALLRIDTLALEHLRERIAQHKKEIARDQATIISAVDEPIQMELFDD